MRSVEIVEKAVALANARLAAAPSFQVFSSTVAQMEYLLSVLRGVESDRSRLKNIIVGHLAVREFAESDPELAEALHAAQNIASQAAKELKG